MKRALFFVELVLDVLIHITATILFFGSIMLADTKINIGIIFGGITFGVIVASLGYKYTQSIKKRYSEYIPISTKENEEE